MGRVLEQLSGVGEIFEGDHRRGTAHYTIRVYQKTHAVGGFGSTKHGWKMGAGGSSRSRTVADGRSTPATEVSTPTRRSYRKVVECDRQERPCRHTGEARGWSDATAVSLVGKSM
jgi:hypothetical protein